MLEVFRRPLPVCFRIVSTVPHPKLEAEWNKLLEWWDPYGIGVRACSLLPALAQPVLCVDAISMCSAFS
jgi:hypothetical protein